jgi:glutaredoxin
VHHTVALKSSTLGSLSLDRDEEMIKWRADSFGGGAAAKKSSTPAPPPPQPQLARRQRQAAPVAAPAKTPVREPPEVINVWELMEGLDVDDAKNEECDCAVAVAEGVNERSPPPGSPEFDPEIISEFRKALGEVSPPRDRQHGDGDPVRKREIQRFPGIVRARVSAFQQRIDAKLAKMARPPQTPTPPSPSPPPSPPPQPRLPPPPDSDRKVVLYLTSLRGIRKTFEDCWAAKSILHGYGVRVDERDLSLHGGFKDELHAALGSAGKLPQVFVDGEHLGGADDVRRMHEAGELSKALEACEMAPLAVGGGKGVAALEACSGCGGVRFVPCEECSGSCKVFLEELDSFRRCPECNENGLVRCPLCCL